MAGPGSDGVIEQLVLAIEAAGFPEATDAVVGLRDEVAGLSEEVAGLSATMGEGGAAAAAGGGKGLFRTLTSFKALLAGLGIAAAVSKFSSFQSQMERLRTQTGATQFEVSHMSKGILSMAASVGTGPSSLAEALYHIESAGYRGKTALDALRVAAQGAKIGGANLTDTTTAMTAVMVAGFKGVRTLREAMGQLNATVGAGDMTMQDLNDALGTGILSTMKTLGLQVKDTGAALAVLGDNNIRGAQAATRLRMGLMTLVHPSSTAAAAMRELGLAPLKLAEDLRKPNGLLVMLTDLKGRLKDLSPTQQASDLASIFGGGRNSAAMLTLINQLDRLKTKYAEVGKGGRDFGADWKATTRTLSFFLDQIKALGEVALIKFGGALNWVIGKVEGLVSAFQHGKVWAVLFVGAIAGTAAVAAVSGTISMLGSLKTAVLGLFATGEEAGSLSLLASGPFGWIILAGTALAILVLKVKPVRQAFIDAFHAITGAARAAFGWLKSNWPLVLAILAGPVGLAALFVVKHWHQIVEGAEWLWGKIKSIFTTLFNVMTWPYREWFKIAKGIFEEVVHIVEWMVKKVESLLGKVLGPIKAVGGFLGKAAGFVTNPIGSIGHAIGIPGLAGGGSIASPGMALVGERGPELVYLGRGASVEPNDQLGSTIADAIRGVGGASGLIQVKLDVDGQQLAKKTVHAGLEARSRL